MEPFDPYHLEERMTECIGTAKWIAKKSKENIWMLKSVRRHLRKQHGLTWFSVLRHRWRQRHGQKPSA